MTRSSHCVLALSGFVWLAGCAQSAIDEVLDGVDASAVIIPGDAQADAADALDAGVGRDAGSIPVAQPDTSFADLPDAEDETDGSGEGDDAGDEDASEPDAGSDAGTRADAGSDAGRVDAGSDASVPDAGPSCSSGQTLCGSACVNTASESAHCGQCNNACTASQVCTASKCEAVTPTPTGCTAGNYGGHSYFFCTSADREDDWVDARRSCLTLNMDLAVPNTEAENNFIQANNASKKLWVGVSDRNTEGQFKLVQFGTENNTNGTAIGYSKWNAGEPNNSQNCVLGFICTGSDEDCVELSSDGTWNDARCNNTHPYACESYQ